MDNALDRVKLLIREGRLVEAELLLRENNFGSADFILLSASPEGQALLAAWRKNARRSFPVRLRNINRLEWLDRFGRALTKKEDKHG